MTIVTSEGTSVWAFHIILTFKYGASSNMLLGCLAPRGTGGLHKIDGVMRKEYTGEIFKQHLKKSLFTDLSPTENLWGRSEKAYFTKGVQKLDSVPSVLCGRMGQNSCNLI